MGKNNIAAKRKSWMLVILAFALLAMLLWVESAYGNLTALVTPGYQFPTSGTLVTPTYELWNELGQPVITIVGTIGGSNTIAAASITGVQMVDGFPDGGVLNLPLGATLGWNVNSPRQLAVNTAGIIDGMSDMVSQDTNALAIYTDTSFFLSSTNSLGNTNLTSVNTGSGIIQWLTLKAHSLYDANIAPGGISSVSITNAGLQAYTLNHEQIFTNVFQLTGTTYTNTFTNFNTAVLGYSNSPAYGMGQVVNLGPGFTVVTVTNVVTLATNATTYFATNTVPTLQFSGFNGSLPLEANIAPWTNSVTGSNNVATSYTNALSAFIFGGAVPYSNNWRVVSLTLQNGLTTVNSYKFSNTNSATTTFICNLTQSGSTYAWFILNDTLTDATYQSTSPQAVVFVHFP